MVLKKTSVLEALKQDGIRVACQYFDAAVRFILVSSVFSVVDGPAWFQTVTPGQKPRVVFFPPGIVVARSL